MSDTPETLLQGAGGYASVPDHHGGVAIAEVLQGAGVGTLFCLPGGHLGAVTDGCGKAGMRIVGTRHESAAVHMAEAWARCTGETGVAGITAGPGFTNCVTGVANANAGGVPLVVFGGRTPLGLRGKGAVQDVDQEALARPITKWAKAVTSPDLLPSMVVEALTVARSGRPGPAYVELPTDVLTSETPSATASVPRRAATSADPGLVDAAVRLLASAERPVCLVGGGAFWAAAGDELAAFSEATSIPVATNSYARGLLPDSHPGCMGSILHGGLAITVADVVLLVGSRLNGNLLFGGPPLWTDQHRIVQIDCDGAAFGLNRPPDVGLLGDAAAVLRQLTEAWAVEPKKAWLDEAQSYRRMSVDHWNAQAEGTARGVHPGFLAREVCRFTAEQGPGSTLVVDGGDILGWGLAFAQQEQAGSMLFTSDSLGTLGVGVPYAVAAPLARTEGPTVALIGDGAFGFSAMELETAARIGTAPVVVVSNNGSWGDVRYEETEWFGATYASDLTPARYDRLGEALGGRGERVERPEDLRPALERAVASGQPSVIDVVTDPDKPNEILMNMGALNLQ
jgi:acetolactate synthase-1/2/3 large subunit